MNYEISHSGLLKPLFENEEIHIPNLPEIDGQYKIHITFILKHFFVKEKWILSSDSKTYSIHKSICSPQELVQTFDCKELTFIYEEKSATHKYFTIKNHTNETWTFNHPFQIYFKRLWITPFQEINIPYQYDARIHVQFNNQYLYSANTSDSATYNNLMLGTQHMTSKSLKFSIKYLRNLQREDIDEQTEFTVNIKLTNN